MLACLVWSNINCNL